MFCTLLIKRERIDTGAVMDRKKFRYTKIILFALVVAVISGTIIYGLDQSIKKTRREIVAARIQNVADYQIQNLIRMYENYTASWGHLIRQNHGEVSNFPELARKMYTEWNNPAIISIRLAPDGIVNQYIYPKGEEVYINLFEEADRRKDAEYARDTGEMTVSEPIRYYPRDDREIVIRNPIFLNSGRKSRGEFWGFSILILDHEKMLKYTELSSPNILYDYKVQSRIEDEDGPHTITESDTAPLEDPVDYEFPVANTMWRVQGTWHGGWMTQDEQRLEWLVWFMTVLISTFLYGFAERHRRLMTVSYTDGLTQVMNRSALRIAFEGFYKKKKRINVMLFDLDFFKQINDTYGHEAGDFVLKKTGDILSAIFRQETCYRYGGDEFLVIDESDAKTMQEKIARLRSGLSELKYKDIALKLTISGGCVSGVPKNKENMRDMLHRADEKLYDSKKAGKNSVQYDVMECFPEKEIDE